MTPALAVLDEVRMRGGAAYRLGDRVRIIPASAASADLLERIRQQKQQLLPLLPVAPPHVASATAVESTPPCQPWIVSPRRRATCDFSSRRDRRGPTQSFAPPRSWK